MFSGQWSALSMPIALKADNPIRSELSEASNAQQRHVAMDFIGQKADSMAHTLLPADRRSESERPAHEDKLGAECQRLEYVRAPANAAVHHYGDIRTSSHDIGYNSQGRHCSVQLTAPMVRYDDALGPRVPGDASVPNVENALDNEPSFPDLADHFEVPPIQVPTVRIVSQNVWRHDRRPARSVIVLEMRHAMTKQRTQEGTEQPSWMGKAVPRQARSWPQWG